MQANSQERGASERENAEKLKQLDRLTAIMRQQQQLLDKTFRAQQGGDGGQDGTPGQQQEGSGDTKFAAGLKKRQEDVRKQLQELLQAMKAGEGDAVRQKLKEAEAAMGEAASALDQNDLGEAGDQEGRALESMRQGTRSMAQQMAGAPGQGNGFNQGNRDPFGRTQPDSEMGDSGETALPNDFDVQRARTILDELRKRLGEPARPPMELDYLERLVKPY